MPDRLHLVRFVLNGEPDLGELRYLPDGALAAILTELDGSSRQVILTYSDGTMPENVSDVEIIQAPATPSSPEQLSPTVLHERLMRTGFILDQHQAGILDDQEAGEQLWNHLFGR